MYLLVVICRVRLNQYRLFRQECLMRDDEMLQCNLLSLGKGKKEKNVIARFLFLNPLPICPIISKWSREISCDLLTQCFTLKC